MTLRDLPFDPTIEVTIGIKGSLAYAEAQGVSEGWLFYRDTRWQAHFESIEALEFEGEIPRWERDIVNFPLSNHPFLSGRDKFDAMLEIERVATKLEWFFYPLTLKDIP